MGSRVVTLALLVGLVLDRASLRRLFEQFRAPSIEEQVPAVKP